MCPFGVSKCTFWKTAKTWIGKKQYRLLISYEIVVKSSVVTWLHCVSERTRHSYNNLYLVKNFIFLVRNCV